MHKIELTKAERHALIAAAMNERTRNRERRDAPSPPGFALGLATNAKISCRLSPQNDFYPTEMPFLPGNQHCMNAHMFTLILE